MTASVEEPKPAYCPRCDRLYASMELMEAHLKKHPDYDPEHYED